MNAVVQASDFEIGAWVVQAPYVDEDSSFNSSNETLNRVWELCRYTLQAAVLDTYTDSNTRERRPYEADGLIAAGARLYLQKSAVMWARHSHTYVFTHATWPVEWRQITILLAMQDYMATGQTDLFDAFHEMLYQNTQIEYLDSTGALRTDKMGRHIVGWAPYPTREMWHDSHYQCVSNMYGVHTLKVLSELANVAGHHDNATRFATESQKLQSALLKLMWNATTNEFCDGICADPAVQGHSGIYSQMYSIFLQIAPQHALQGIWDKMVSWGLEHIGDYGAWVYLHALNLYHGDDGTALLNALTKCDQFSWCNEWIEFNATMTVEAWTQGTMSHAWGTAAIPAIVEGLLGVQQTAPTYASFTVRPRLTTALSFANLKIPTPRGPIIVNATSQGSYLKTHVPCGSLATLCIQQPPNFTTAFTVHLDGHPVDPSLVQVEPRHVCVREVGCGPAPRELHFHDK